VDIEKQIKLLEENIIDTKELENEIQQLNKNIRAEIDKIHDEKKGSISIQKKPMSKTNCECTLFFPCCYPPKLYNWYCIILLITHYVKHTSFYQKISTKQ